MLSSNRGTVEDFFLAGRNLAWWSIGASLFASNIGIGHLVALAGTAATSGIVAGAFEWNAPFFLCVLGWIFSPIYIKAGVVTMPEYLRKRFGSSRIQFLLAILYLFLYIFNRVSVEISTSAMVMGLIFGWDVYQATIFLLIFIGIYTITGGFAAVIYTDALHAGVMVLGSVLLMGFAFKEVGGYQELLRRYVNAKPSIIREGNWTAKPECYLPRLDSFHIFRDPITGDLPWPGIVFGISIISLYYWCTDQISVQRCLAGKNISHVKGGCVFCGCLKLLSMFSIVMPGMISRILYPEKVACVTPSECEKYCGTRTSCSSLAYPMLVMKLMPKGIQGLMMSALWASFMSSLASSFNSASAVFTMDIYSQIRPMATEIELMLSGRFFVILLLSATIIWIPIIEVTHGEQLFEYMQSVLGYLVPPIAAIFLLAIFSKRVTEQGAFWGLTSGFLIGLLRMVSEFVYCPQPCSGNNEGPMIICSIQYLYFAIFLFIVSLFTILGISLFTDPILDKHLHRLCWSLRNSQEKREDLDAGMQRKRLGFTLRTQPDIFILGEPQNCLLKALDVCCGLEPKQGPKVAPEEVTMKTVNGTTPEETEYGATSEEVERSDVAEGTERCDTSEWPHWRKVANTSGFLLILITVLCHIFYF
ncbi:sodium/glucose cotransporter 1-like [Pteropus medius]|uniref:sodium/glucose cotransporter 1-like n=1 Tax=Pteropus vampyrus TaxID=132908 RepID=UPI00196A3FA0|nr:sodium/glucose cotransporter 1-like [Pteropus giganteus]